MLGNLLGEDVVDDAVEEAALDVRGELVAEHAVELRLGQAQGPVGVVDAHGFEQAGHALLDHVLVDGVGEENAHSAGVVLAP